MKVTEARFVTSAPNARAIPTDGIPHIALVGRSNVGKSSIINALMRRKLARTSAAPGKTRLANLYRVLVDGGPGGPGRWSVYLADLPGYGYARGGGESVAELARIAELPMCEGARTAPSRVQTRRTETTYRIAGVLHLVDSRHPGLDADRRCCSVAGATRRRRAAARDENRQTVAQRAREEPQGTRTATRNGRPADFGGEAAKDWTICGH